MMHICIDLGEGYGIAFKDCVTTVSEEEFNIIPPQKLKKGKLFLVECGEDGTLMPFVRFGREPAVVAWAFVVHTDDSGWLQIDLASLPHKFADIQAGGITAKYFEPLYDMSEYPV